jgi:hypothetical protein
MTGKVAKESLSQTPGKFMYDQPRKGYEPYKILLLVKTTMGIAS